MKYLLYLLIFILLVSCSTELEQQTQVSFDNKYSIESAQKAITLAKNIQAGNDIDSTQWNELFNSEGYQQYFCTYNIDFRKKTIKESMITVFDNSYQHQLDSILSLLISMENNPYPQFVVRNFNSLKDNLGPVSDFLEKTDFSHMLAAGDSTARTFLSAKARKGFPKLHDMHFFCGEPDAYVTDCGLVVDANNAATMGEEELTKLIAHEYHHNYRALFAASQSHPLMIQLDKIHREGVADLIDKKMPPMTSMGQYPQALIDFFNEAYANTPEKLRFLDSITVAFVNEEMEDSEYEAQVENYFPMGGHPHGQYMARLINQHIGIDSLIDTFDDPVAFIRLYNQVATNAAGNHVFSDTFMQFVNELKSAASKEANKYSDEKYTVTFQVKVPNEKNEVYITGNRPELGDWNPKNVQLKTISPDTREITLDLQAPIEFKFTRGSWQSEGFVKNEIRGPNLSLGFTSDTTFTYTIEAWMDME